MRMDNLKGNITTIRLTGSQVEFLQVTAEKYKQESIAATIRLIIEDFRKQESIRNK
jgi:hypothetical protein